MSTKNKNSTILVNDKEYWKNRHSKTDNLKASGVKSVGVKSNQYIYKILADQYKKLLDDMDLSKIKSVLDCGFGDGYFLKFFKKNYPNFKLYGVDISKDAKNKIDFIPKSNLYVNDLKNFAPKRSFDIVHCFDVMYHILGDNDYKDTLLNMTNLSNKYIILHERFPKKAPLLTSRHVRMRRSEFTNQILNSRGFFLFKEAPTHFFAMRLPTYKLNKLIPNLLYKVDYKIAKDLHPTTQEFLASHHIRVYSKNNSV